MFRFLFFICLFLLVIAFSNTKRPKIFSLFLSTCFFGFQCLVCYLRKSKKILLCLLFSFALCFKNRKPKNICRSSLVCKVCCRVQLISVDPFGLGYHFIIQATQVKSNNDDLRQLEAWREAGMNPICFHFCTYTHLCEHA
jgi:hypothetical protein